MAQKILIVDDEELLIRTMSRLLEKSGYEVYTAKNAADAEVMAEEEDFDLIICDIRMPGKNGIATVESIQKISISNRQKVLPVIFATGFADEGVETEAKKLNPIAYLFKPFDNQEMLNIIKKSLG